jgi:hypothetical protein
MYSRLNKPLSFILAIVSIALMTMMMQASTATAEDLDKDSRQALQTLYKAEPVAEGVAKNLSTTSLKDEAYAFIFSQQGLMAWVSIEGTKISRIDR